MNQSIGHCVDLLVALDEETPKLLTLLVIFGGVSLLLAAALGVP